MTSHLQNFFLPPLFNRLIDHNGNQKCRLPLPVVNFDFLLARLHILAKQHGVYASPLLTTPVCNNLKRVCIELRTERQEDVSIAVATLILDELEKNSIGYCFSITSAPSMNYTIPTITITKQ